MYNWIEKEVILQGKLIIKILLDKYKSVRRHPCETTEREPAFLQPSQAKKNLFSLILLQQYLQKIILFESKLSQFTDKKWTYNQTHSLIGYAFFFFKINFMALIGLNPIPVKVIRRWMPILQERDFNFLYLEHQTLIRKIC